MRIISKFKDYYDSVQAYGQDNSIAPYIRESKTIEFHDRQLDTTKKTPYYTYIYKSKDGLIYPFKSYVYHRRYDNGNSDVGFCNGIIGFCGSIYPFIAKVTFQSNNVKYEHVYETYYDLDKFMHKYENVLSNRFISSLKNKFDNAIQDKDKYSEWFEKLDCPIFLSEEDHANKYSITINPRLKDFQFFKKFDVNSAYQELSMYMSNIAEPRKKMPEISDELKAQAHGFDKWSFRKEPSKKKRTI